MNASIKNFMRLGQYDKASALLSELPLSDDDARVEAAVLYYLSGNLKELKIVLDQIMSKDENYYLIVGLKLVLEGKHKLALDCLITNRSREYRVVTLKAIIKCYLETKASKELVDSAFKELDKLSAAKDEVMLEQIKILLQRGQVDEAEKAVKKLAVMYPTSSFAREAKKAIIDAKVSKPVPPVESRVIDTVSKPESREDDGEDYSEYPFSLLKDFVGMKPLKVQLKKLCHQIDYQQKRKLYQGVDKSIITGMNFIFNGNPGTGKTSAARVIGQILHHYGLLSSDTVIETDRSGLVAEYIGHTEKKTMEVIQSAVGGVLFIDEAYTLYKEDNPRDFGIQAIECILKAMEDRRGELCFIFAGYNKEMNQFLNANPGLRDRISYTIDFPDYTNEELLTIAGRIARKDYALGISESAEKALIKKIEMKRVDETFGNARVVRNLLAEAYAEKSYRVSRSKFVIQENMNFVPQDFGVSDDGQEDKEFERALNKLMGITGQTHLKEEIKRKVTFAKVDAIRQNKLGKRSTLNNHMVFTGSPGTGKTTFARVIGELYKSIGILKRGEFIETKASDFISQNVGGSREKTIKMLKRALGNVLFIDEAYSLINGGEDAIEEILKFMEDNNDNFILILAGYTNEIDELLNMNPGLRSRINTYIPFEDYNAEELLQIFKKFAKSDDMILTDGTEEPLKKIIERMVENKDENFGNARDIRNLYEKVKQYQAIRFDEMKLGIEDINTIEASDVMNLLTS